MLEPVLEIPGAPCKLSLLFLCSNWHWRHKAGKHLVPAVCCFAALSPPSALHFWLPARGGDGEQSLPIAEAALRVASSLPSCRMSPMCFFAPLQWMRARWTSDPCYAFFGVDGTECSFLIYLSEVEWFCPPLPWRNRTEPLPSPPPLPRGQVRLGQSVSC